MLVTSSRQNPFSLAGGGSDDGTAGLPDYPHFPTTNGNTIAKYIGNELRCMFDFVGLEIQLSIEIDPLRR